ncbi:Transposon Tn10 TetD protein [Poriferisphaera corsica]|uniref:Transposon Tn10 TetD protein n=1 Tax=Poriferisphaera corsica TaxID=2528020 RepID=A0A517YWI2_9BACT|nr:AraC family transcriptional regulator [Poriferisphaera corsica]QDU34557.1 Transposon Tn10 TetD protein [Poriferisphaera corsica]
MPENKSTCNPSCIPLSTDPLGQTLHSFRMSGLVYAKSSLSAPWGAAMPPMPGCLLFHVVTAGQCLIQLPDQPIISLTPGQFALIPHGLGHNILSDPDTPPIPFFDLPVQQITPHYEILNYGGGGEHTSLICGAVRFDNPAATDLVKQLPNIIHLETWGTTDAEAMHATLRLIAAEAEAQQPGGDTIITRLADILVIQAIRRWLDQSPEAQSGWLGALKDERIGPAILNIHNNPAQNWTVESLAKSAHMSRSAFAARFMQTVGESPLKYLTRYRMHTAATWLRDSDISLIDCALKLGYTSEAAFSRAFKRTLNQSPGLYRSNQPI